MSRFLNEGRLTMNKLDQLAKVLGVMVTSGRQVNRQLVLASANLTIVLASATAKSVSQVRSRSPVGYATCRLQLAEQLPLKIVAAHGRRMIDRFP